MRLFDMELPKAQVFRCICPHCGHERFAVDNGKAIQARFTKSACDSTLVQCGNCGVAFERKAGMRRVNTLPFGHVLARIAV